LVFEALYHDTTGGQNTATGRQALFSNTTGDSNTATGFSALNRNTTGDCNTANGFNALSYNTIGNHNTATGRQALFRDADGVGNTATGALTPVDNTTCDYNTAIGVNALNNNTTGSSNTAIGVAAGDFLTGNGNVCIGRGVHGVAGENNTTPHSQHFDTVQPIVGIDPDYVTINSSGRLGRANVSSRRYKHDIKPMDKASETLFKLKPVSFRYNKQYDATQTIAFSLIAEEVAEVNPDLVGRTVEGQPESVRYEQINPMLLNEFLKEHRTVQEQGQL